jgi:ergothioneine biosynthesis protein EgtB
MLRAGRAVEATSEAAERRGEALLESYRRVRAFTEELCKPLAVEDFVVQSMPDASPTKWHLCHVTWFFEQFVLREALPDYSSPFPVFAHLFNSYYVQAGTRFPRPLRGTLSRPTVAEAFTYRAGVDAAIGELLEKLGDRTGAPSGGRAEELRARIELGVQHEQQHQELILTDIKHAFGHNPLRPAYAATAPARPRNGTTPARWIPVPGGVREIGHAGGGFSFDNERPRHRVYLEPYELASRPVTSGEYLAFLRDDGYRRPDLWLAEGWDAIERERWRAPLYWIEQDGIWHHYTLRGFEPVDDREPVCHLSYYEADAFARWAGARLPTEAEWEVAAASERIAGNLLEDAYYHPAPADPTRRGLQQLYGDVWEWTRSPYTPYPGFRAAAGALGEYNGKFMCNQLVLRGGACTTPSDHVRATYRNFLPASARWFFSGLRLARGES